MELHCSLQNHELGARPPAYLWLCWLWGRGWLSSARPRVGDHVGGVAGVAAVLPPVPVSPLRPRVVSRRQELPLVPETLEDDAVHEQRDQAQVRVQLRLLAAAGQLGLPPLPRDLPLQSCHTVLGCCGLLPTPPLHVVAVMSRHAPLVRLSEAQYRDKTDECLDIHCEMFVCCGFDC